MLGQIVYCGRDGGRLRVEQDNVAGLSVLQVRLDPEGFWARRRMKQAGRLLARAGSRRVLVPETFEDWSALERAGLRRVDPFPFLRGHAAQLAIASLQRQGRAPERCTVALRGARVGRNLAQTARELCPQVRDICITAPKGGEELRRDLRWEFGIAVRPDDEMVPAAVRFDRQTWDRGETVLDLFPPEPELGQVEICLPGLERWETERFSLLAALWEAGKVRKSDLEFT